MKMRFGLIKGRHELPEVDGYFFEGDVNPLDPQGLEQEARKFLQSQPHIEEIDLYVTGLTVALIAAINVINPRIKVVLYHFNRDTGEYYPQPVYREAMPYGY